MKKKSTGFLSYHAPTAHLHTGCPKKMDLTRNAETVSYWCIFSGTYCILTSRCLQTRWKVLKVAKHSGEFCIGLSHKGSLTYYVIGLQEGVRAKWRKYYGNNMSWFSGVHWNAIMQVYPRCGNRWRNTLKFMEGSAESSPSPSCVKMAHILLTMYFWGGVGV